MVCPIRGGSSSSGDPESGRSVEPGERDTIWILDVDGHRVVIAEFVVDLVDVEASRSIDAIIDSMEFASTDARRHTPGMTLWTVAELHEHLGDPDLRVVDVRWTLGQPGVGPRRL